MATALDVSKERKVRVYCKTAMMGNALNGLIGQVYSLVPDAEIMTRLDAEQRILARR